MVEARVGYGNTLPVLVTPRQRAIGVIVRCLGDQADVPKLLLLIVDAIEQAEEAVRKEYETGDGA